MYQTSYFTFALLGVLLVPAAEALVARHLVHLHATKYPTGGQDCSERHDGDLYRPIADVLREHPGADGNCWFKFYADYLGDPESYAQFANDTAEQFTPKPLGKPITLHLPDGLELSSHDDGVWGNYGFDDGMCYMMGWLKGQRLDQHVGKMKDREAWLKISEQECARLPGMVPGGLDEKKLSIGYMSDDNERICQASQCLKLPYADPCIKATREDYVYHLYPKCLLGGDRLTGAAGQIAWCFARACVTEGNVIKHGKDCFPDGLPF